ncbi:hypothetical protein LINPERHAP1_LOCUS12950, partial [Linum perenne]
VIGGKGAQTKIKRLFVHGSWYGGRSEVRFRQRS